MKEFRDELLLSLADRLHPLGFRLRKTSRDFRRDVGRCSQLLHIAFINHSDDFDVTADVAVRHHTVEDVLNEETAYLKESEKKLTATVGAELGNILGTGQHRWTVASARDVPIAVDGIVSYFERVGLPFLERYTSLEETFRVLSENGSEAVLISPLREKRARVREIIGGLLTSHAS